MNLSEVTVLLPTRNESHNIARFLDSLHPDLELIVVDSSSDDTVDCIMALRPHRTRVIVRPCNVTEARQLGAEQARTDWLLFTDADVTFAPDYFSRLAQVPTADPMLGLIFGVKDTADGQFKAYHRLFKVGQWLFDKIGVPAATGSNLIIRREALMRVGGFDLRLTCNEDSEVAWRVKRAGYRVRFVPQLVTYSHDHRRLRRGVVRKLLHSAVRCILLYVNALPDRWRSRDWGYWSVPPSSGEDVESSLPQCRR